MFRSFTRSLVAATAGIVLGAGLVPAGIEPSTAAPPKYRPLQVQREQLVPGRDATFRPSVPDPAAERALRQPPAAPVWPHAATAELATSTALRPDTLSAQVVGGLPIQVSTPARAAATPSRVRVRVLDGAATNRKGRLEVLLRLGRADGGSSARPVELAVGYQAFRTAYGADWANRLRLVRLPECALTTPEKEGCAGTPLASKNSSTGWVSASVTAAPAGQESLYALAAGASGETGSFAATGLSPSAAWSAGGNAGNFSWRYPMRTPSAPGGLRPTVELSYSSQSVDGRHAASNNQPSWVGEGFELWSGYIERSYRPCSEDLGGNNGQTKTGDLCWATYNAVLTLGGKGGELIWDGSKYRPRREDGTKIERLTSPHEYWKVTTTDGTQFFFGRNKLPGWDTSKPTTQSIWKVPVFGNHSGEPCHQSTFDASHCSQPWRWNLDYVIDTHGNTMSFWYAPEGNKYARNLTGSKVSSYTRGGTLTRIDYGTRGDTAYGTVPMRVEFTPADRCLSNCSTHGANWPDTPWDQECTSSTSCNDYSPSFWTTKRLAKVTTKVLKSGSLTNVETWTLKHTFPDPGDTTRAGLWLAAIGHSGVPSEVKFVGIQLDNRVDGNDHSPAMKWWRVAAIRTEFGGDIGITYSPPDCIAGSRMPSRPETNNLRCYPSRWTPEGYTEPVLDYFHKYTVARVDETDLSGGSVMASTEYVYEGNPAWHYTDADGLLTKKQKTWSVWRGYQSVKTYRGLGSDRSFKRTLYFRGMHGDKLPTGTRSASIVDSEGVSVVDHEAFAGMTREELLYDGPTGAVVSAAILDPWQSAPTASRTIEGVTVHARYVDTAKERHRTALDAGRGWRRTATETTFDSYGMPVHVNDFGDESTSDDDQCTRYTYARNTGDWLMEYRSRVQVDALSCDRNPASADDVISDERRFYDGQAFGVPPTKGDVTRLEALSGWANGTPSYYVASRATYDPCGRVAESYDAENHRSTATYTPAMGGPVTSMRLTNGLGHSATTDYDPAWGVPTRITEANGRVTELKYDVLGQLTHVWLPGRSRASGDGPNMMYAYHLPTRAPDGQPDGVNAVSTTALAPNGNYVTSHVLYDGLLRPRQTQSPAGDGSGDRIITDTFYDNAGRAYKTNNPYYSSGAPSSVLFAPAGGDGQIPSQTLTRFDGANRQVASILRRFGQELWRTSYGFGGDHVDVTPPSGGTATTAVVDGRDNLVQLRQYHGPSPSGTYDLTTYSYNRKNQLSKVTDPAGNVWRYGYDIRGRQNVTDDPDKGRNQLAFNNLDQVLASTDSRQRTLVYTYDELGRKTQMFESSLTGPKLAEWTYDTATGGIGLPASAIRYVGSDAYRVEVTGYDAGGRTAGQRITIPAAEGKLAGSYTFRDSYYPNGSLKTRTVPAAGGLPGEVLGFSYDDTGKPTALSTSINFAKYHYVERTQYTKLGEPGVYTFALSGTDPIVQQGFTYDETTRRLVRAISTKETSPTPVADVNYTWDPAGNIVKIDDTASSDSQCFAHDYLRRLVEAWTPATGDCTAPRSVPALGGPAPYWHSYGYDKVGNRKTLVKHATQDESTQYAYPPPGTAQPHTVLSTTTTKGDVTSSAQYNYDTAGNTTSRPSGDGQQTLVWDAEGRLESSGTTSYLYDPAGHRLIRRDPTGTTLYLPGMELRYSKSSDSVSAKRYYAHGGMVIAMRDTSGVTWLLPDHQGTAEIAVGATAAQPVTRRWKTPFGQRRGAPAQWPNDRGFQNGVEDPSGTVHMGARDYDPSLGRFLSVDPIIEHGDPQQMHGYSYANSSPITSADPDGLYVTSGAPKDEGKGCKHNCTTTGTKKKSGGKKPDGQPVIVNNKYVGLLKRCSPGPCVGYRLEIYGKWVSCAPVANAVGPCFADKDGYTWDLYGHKSCARQGEAGACLQGPPQELPKPQKVFDKVVPVQQPQPPTCETPGQRREREGVIRPKQPPTVMGLLAKGPQNWTPTDAANLLGAVGEAISVAPAPVCPICSAAALVLAGVQVLFYTADGEFGEAVNTVVITGAGLGGGAAGSRGARAALNRSGLRHMDGGFVDLMDTISDRTAYYTGKEILY